MSLIVEKQEFPNSIVKRAFDDIMLGIDSGIVHKYVVDNADDCIKITKLSKICEELGQDLGKNKHYLFGYCFFVAHTMVNPRIIEEMGYLMMINNGDLEKVMQVVTSSETRERWNTEEFHREMKAVAGNYREIGGYEPGNVNGGIASEILQMSPLCLERIDVVAKIVESWLSDDIVSEDVLINDILNVNIPGKNCSDDCYGLLHFCRGISLIRQKFYNKPTLQSEKYLDMPGTKLLRNKYDTIDEEGNIVENLHGSDMESLYNLLVPVIKEKAPDVIFTYGDFGCLTCESHRLQDEFRKRRPDFDWRWSLGGTINSHTHLNAWLEFKNRYINQRKLAPSIVNSARSNVEIYLSWIDSFN